MTVSRRSLVKVDPELPLIDAALFGCAVLTGVGAVVNTARIPVGASVAVIGLGGGPLSLLGAIAAGAREVIAIDLSAEKLAFASWARRRCTTRVIRSAPPDPVRDEGGVEYAFELAGSVPALDLAYTITRRGDDRDRRAARPRCHAGAAPVSLVAEERTLKGSYIGTAVPSRDIPRYIELYQRGRLPVDRLLTGRSISTRSTTHSTSCTAARPSGR